MQSQPIGLRKIFIDFFFFQANQWDCTKSLSFFNRFASSEECFRTFLAKFVACQFSHAGFRPGARGYLEWVVNQRNPSGYWQVVTGGELGQIICLGLAFLKVLVASGRGHVISDIFFRLESSRSSPVFAEQS